MKTRKRLTAVFLSLNHQERKRGSKMGKKGKMIATVLVAALLLQMVLPVGMISQKVYAADNVPTEEVLPGIYYTTYISEINVSGAGTKKDAKQPLIDGGFKIIDYNLNEGVGGDYIYLGYKTTTDYDQAIKDLWLAYDVEDMRDKTTIVLDGSTYSSLLGSENYVDSDGKTVWDGLNYYSVGCLGSEDFIDGNGNLNSGADDKHRNYVHLFYTKEEKDDKKGLVDIYFDRNMYNAVSDMYEKTRFAGNVWKNGVSLNAGLQAAEDDIWMHINRATTGERIEEKNISSKNWMRKIPDNVKITALNIPGCHDAGTQHTVIPDFIGKYAANCQEYPIGDNVWINKHLSGKKTKVYEDGLLTQGYRYFDIRYGVEKNKLDSYDLKIVHNAVPAVYQVVEDALGMPGYNILTNDKVMEWIKKFLYDNPSETVILECCEDDGSDGDQAVKNYQKFFSELAKNPNNKKYPQIYVGDHVPTMGEARGKIVVLAESMSAEELKVGEGKYWGFRSAGGSGDTDNRTTGKITKGMDDDLMEQLNYNIYKNNQWDSVLEEGKWEWVNNGLNDSQGIFDNSKNEGVDSFVEIYTSANNLGYAKDALESLEDLGDLDASEWVSYLKGVAKVLDVIEKVIDGAKGLIPDYSNYVNPRVISRMQGDLSDKFVGIIATDNGGENLSRAIWQSNYNRKLPETGTVVGNGNTWIIVGIAVVFIAAGACVVVYRRRKRKVASSKEKS